MDKDNQIFLMAYPPLPKVDMQQVLAQMSVHDADYLQIAAPSWILSDEYDAAHLRKQLQSLIDLYSHGKVVWAAVVQANQLLWEAMPVSCPAEVVFDPEGQIPIEQLLQTAHALYAVKNTQPDDAELAEYAAHLTVETQYAAKRVPKAISGDRCLYTNTPFIWRLHLPDGVLSLPYFPILVCPDRPDVVTVLPARFWADSALHRYWLEHSHDETVLLSAAMAQQKGHLWRKLPSSVLYPPSAALRNLLNPNAPPHTDNAPSEASKAFLQACLQDVHSDNQQYRQSRVVPMLARVFWWVVKIAGLLLLFSPLWSRS